MSPRVDLLLSGVWTDTTSVTSQSRDKAPGLSISRGRGDWQSSLSYGRMDFGLLDNAGTYSPRNPNSSLYGIIGPNTPVRASVETLTDAFGRTASNGWGSADTGQAYSTNGGAASAYSVSSGTGRIAISATNSIREVYTDDVDAADVVVRDVVRPGAVATGTSGHSIQLGVTARRADASNYYYGVVSFLVGGTAEIFIAKRVAGSVTVIDSSSQSLPYTAGSAFGVELTVCGDRLELRAWDTADPTAVLSGEASDSDLTAAGSVGVYAALNSGITNTLPFTVQFDDQAVLNPRFCGEIPSWPPRWDPSGRDVWVPIQASGIVRRLSRSGPLRSALRAYLEGLAADPDADQPVAGWLLEDGSFATSAAPIFGAYSMYQFRGQHPSGALATYAQWGKGDLGPAFPPVLSRSGTSGLTIVYGRVAMPFLQTTWSIDHVYASPTGGQVSTMDVNPSYLGGSAGWPQLTLDPGAGTVSVSFDGSPETTTDVPDLFDGLPHYIRWSATQDGADVDWDVTVDDVSVNSGTETTSTVPVVESVALVSETATGSPVAQGYLMVWADNATAEAVQAGMGYPGESAADRIRRLCGQAGVACVIVGDPDDTQPMGVQRLGTLIEHLTDCETVDQGIVHEPRALLGIGYRTGRSLLNQTPIELDYEQGHISPPFEPEDDDQLRRNDVTVTDALGGASYRWQVTDGPLSVASPPDGAGPYEQQVSAAAYNEADLRDLASWLAHLGTWDEHRYPRVTINLMRSVYAGDAALTAQVAAVDIGAAAQVDNLPSFLPPDPARLLVRGCDEYLDEVSWTLGWLCTPSGPYTVGVWDSSRYDSSASTLADDFVAGTDTSMQVAVEAGKTHWVTGSGSPQFPFDVGVHGARVTVSAVAAAATPTSQVGTVDHDNNASLTPGLPASITDGDVLLLLAAIRNSGTGSPNTPTNWTRLDVFPDGANVQLFGLVAAGAVSGPTVSFTGGAANASTSARIVRLRGMKVHDIDELVMASAAQLNSSAQDIDYPYLNVRQPNGVALYCGWKQDDWTSVATISGATEVIDDSTTSGDDQGIVMDFRKMTDAVDIAPGVFTVTGGASAISRGAVAVIRDSYQTFTVSSTVVNGVAKTISAGRKVSLWTPARYAL